MRCVVYNKNKYTVANCAVLLFFALSFRLAPKIFSAYEIYVVKLYFEFASTLLFAAVLYTVMRRIAIGYVYSIEERGVGDLDFSILCLRGEKVRGRECVLSLSALVFCAPVGSRNVISDAKRKYADGGFKLYDYTVSSHGEFLLLVFEDGYGYSALLVEPNDAMREYLLSVALPENI